MEKYVSVDGGVEDRMGIGLSGAVSLSSTLFSSSFKDLESIGFSRISTMSMFFIFSESSISGEISEILFSARFNSRRLIRDVRGKISEILFLLTKRNSKFVRLESEDISEILLSEISSHLRSERYLSGAISET